MAFNPWHSVSYGDQAPEIVDAIIEIPRGSRGKFELDKESGMLRLDRVLYHSITYPLNYGFIPQTYCDDKDPLDILILSQVDIPSMCLVSAKIIGVMRMIDGGEGDDKLIAVAADDPTVNHLNDLSDLPAHQLKEIRQFFEEYKALENKKVEITAFEDAAAARKILLQSIEDYKAKFGVQQEA